MQRWTTRCLQLSVAGLGLLASAAALAASPTYRIAPVAKGNGVVPTSASAISDNGNVAGSGRVSGEKWNVTFIARSGQKPQPLEGSEGAPGYNLDVNNAGDVLGYYLRDEGDSLSLQGAMWHGDGTMVPLVELAGCTRGTDIDYSIPLAINEAGDAVFNVHCLLNGAPVDGPVVRYQGVVSVLPDLGGGQTYAQDINGNGQVTGFSMLPPDSHGISEAEAFIWQNGVMTPLGTLGGKSSYADAINELGHVAGTSVLASGSARTFLFDGASMRELPRCDGKNAATPVGITNDDRVVGVYGGRKNRHTALIEGGKCQLLDALLNTSGADWTNLHATGVNNQGVIVGDGLYLGKERAFIATPIAADQR